MDIVDILIRVSLGVGIGFCIGMTGVGGGVLVIPALTLFLKLKAPEAIGTASLYSVLTKTYATYKHSRLKTIAFKPALLFLVGALPADIIVSYAINQYLQAHRNENQTLAAFEDHLKMFMGMVILASVFFLVLNLIVKSRKKNKTDPREKQNKPLKYSPLQIFSIVLLGTLVGGLIGSTSIGGGVLIIPALIMVFGMRTERAVGTSIFIAVVLTLATAVIYGKSARLDGMTAGLMALGSLFGVHWGSKLSVKLPEKVLQGILIFLIFTAALMMVI